MSSHMRPHTQRQLYLGIILLGLVTPPAQAQSVGSPPSEVGWYVGIASGWYFPIQQWPTAYVLRGGVTYFVGRRLDPQWGVQLDVNMWLLSGSQRSTWDMKTGPTLQWMPSAARVAPFALVGVGVDLQTNYPARSSTVGAMVP